LGGSASYISLTASYFSDTVRLVGVVGHDFDPNDRARFTERGIDLEGLQTDTSGKPFFWAGKYHEDLNTRDTLVTELNVFEHFQPVIPEAHRDSRIVCLGN